MLCRDAVRTLCWPSMVQTAANHILPGKTSQAPHKGKRWKKNLKDGVSIIQVFLPCFLPDRGSRRQEALPRSVYSPRSMKEIARRLHFKFPALS